MLSHISFASIPVTDPDRAKAFWSDTMGLEPTVDAPMGEMRWIMLRFPGNETQIHLYHVDAMPIATMPAIPLIASDVAAFTETLRSRGVEITREPGPAEWDADTTYSLIKDSEGNIVLIADR